MKSLRILITTYPFGKSNDEPMNILLNSGCEVVNNPYNRRLKNSEIPELIKDFDIIIAGTENYSIEALESSKVKAICRVGIGLDNVPLNYCKEKGIVVTYTPDAPSQGVAELTLANILNMSRHILKSDRSVREHAWNRYLGYLLEEMTIGIVGLGRIGSKVAGLLQPFNTKILATEITDKSELAEKYKIELVDKKTLFKESNLVTLHIPSNKNTFHYVDREVLSWMKTGSFLINTSRGPIVDEDALYDALVQNHLQGASLDVFNTEPYEGKLIKLENVIFTAHMGASANKSRYLMELGAAQDCLNFLNNKKLQNDAITEDNLSTSKE
jgi:D-3-phosphoglycerate dehydrogenase